MSQQQAQSLNDAVRRLATRHGTVVMGCRTAIMGVLNVTPDSFYDGGRRPDAEKAIADGVELAAAGADIIDIGGESTRPGARSISEEEELDRVLPVVRGLRREVSIPISIDTYKSHVARAALGEGADIVNDISALRMQGTPRTMQAEPRYSDVVREVKDFLAAQMRHGLENGIELQRIIIDPGIGFGKTLEHNLSLLRGLADLSTLGQPLLLGASRKAFIGKILNVTPDERLEGSLAAAVAAVLAGASIIRAHDVKETRRAVSIADAIRYGAGGGEEESHG